MTTLSLNGAWCPLDHWNWKWKQVLSECGTYDQELLARRPVLSSLSCLRDTKPIVWLCDQEPTKTFQKAPLPEKVNLKEWWT